MEPDAVAYGLRSITFGYEGASYKKQLELACLVLCEYIVVIHVVICVFVWLYVWLYAWLKNYHMERDRLLSATKGLATGATKTHLPRAL